MGRRKKFDKDDILKYIYGEMAPHEERDLLDALQEDEALFEVYRDLRQGREGLKRTELAPSEGSLDNIMSYARTALHKKENRMPSRHKSRFFSFRNVVTGAMVGCTALTIAFALMGYQRSFAEPEVQPVAGALDWSGESIQRSLDDTRGRLNLILNEREVPVHLHHNTFRMIRTGDFRPGNQDIYLLNLK